MINQYPSRETHTRLENYCSICMKGWGVCMVGVAHGRGGVQERERRVGRGAQMM